MIFMAKIIKFDEAKKKHPIVEQYLAAHDISEDYTARLTAELLNKGMVGKAVNKRTIDDVVSFFHSGEVADAIRKVFGAKTKELSDEELLARYGLPKHIIKETLGEYKSLTPEVLLRLAQQLGARIHAELVSHHPAAIANEAYDDLAGAQKAMLSLYEVSGGEKYAAANKATIENLLAPDKIHEHMTDLYQRRELQTRMAQDSEKLRGAVYGEGGKEPNIIPFPKLEAKKYKRQQREAA